MEEAKAAAYYDELSRKGEGAARFKQGLGYSAADAAAPSWRSSSSALLSGFVRASAGGKSDPDAAKEAQLNTVKAKLTGKSESFRDPDRRSSRGSRRQEERGRSRSRSRSRTRSPRRERAERRRRRSRSSSPPRERGRRKGRRSRSRSRSRRLSPGRREVSGRENREDHRTRSSRGKEKEKENGGPVDYSQLIDGYSNMTAAERVKAKMKLQLSQTAAKDKVMGKGWERFEFDKDAPLDDEEIEVADDDANLVKDMDRTFRFSSMEAKREADLEAAHDEAIFGVPSALPSNKGNEDAEGFREQDTTDKSIPHANLMSEKVLSAQQVSWRDKVRNRQKE